MTDETTPAGQVTVVVNMMTVDVEDYFHASVFDDAVPRSQWEQLESRVNANTDRLLAMFDEASVHATFFVLGWVAERFPALVRRIAACGHEIASHGYGHRLVYSGTPEAFRADLRRAKRAIEIAANTPVVGYRAPSYSVTTQSLWALDVLIEEGYQYDASIFPIHHDRYGIASSPRHPYRVWRRHGSLWELPGSSARVAGINLPVAGGGYFRLLPYAWTKWGIDRVNRQEGQPVVFYTHPWELDPEQPRIPLPALSRLRHYANLGRTEARLKQLLTDFRFDSIAAVSQIVRHAAVA
jgi:polysaccharide deacetylase family protein (PEP-CTERM system associated)